MRWTKEKDEAVFECLDSLEWVIWEGRKWWADGIWLRDIEAARFLVASRVGFPIGKQTFKSLLNMYFGDFVEEHYPNIRGEKEIVVLRSTPSYLSPSLYLRKGPKEGLWYPVWNEVDPGCSLYFMPPQGDLEILTQEQWPHGMYCIREWGIGKEKSINPSGTIDDLFEYWSVLAQDVEEGWELSLALILPALFRQGNISFMIVGGDYYAQDHFMYRIFRLVDWGITLVAPASAYKQARSLWRQSFVYINRLNGRMASDLKTATLVKFAIDGQGVMVRRPYTDLTVDEFTFHAPVFICTADVKVHEKLASRSLDIHLRNTPEPPYFKDKYRLAPKALMGAFRLFQKASQVQPPEYFSSRIAYRDWMVWAYRYAHVLGVENKFLDYLEKADKLSQSYKKG
jgi:hypothetical protein